MLFFLGMAWGFDVEDAVAERALSEVRAAVEAETGRRIEAMPSITAETQQAWIAAERRRSPPDSPADEPDSTEGMLAFYDPATEGIVVLTDEWDHAVEPLDLSAAEAEGLLGCLLAHELTHAVQHQEGVEVGGASPEERQAALTVVEGHASLVAARVCRRVYGAGVADLLGAVSGDALVDASDHDDVATTYIHGQLYLGLQEELHGREATWSALRSPPPVDEIERALVPVLAARWHKAWELATVDPWPGDGSRWGGRVTARLFVSWLGLPYVYGTTASAPVSRAGLASAYVGAAGAEWRAAFWLESEAAAAAWLGALRAATPTGQSVDVLGYWLTFWAGRPPGGALARRAPRLEPRFADAWYQNGPVVVGVGAVGGRAEDPQRVERLARTLAGTFVADPETDARLATMARLRAGTPAQPLPAQPPG